MKKPMSPPNMPQLLAKIADDDPQRLLKIFSGRRPVDEKGRYLHWDQMRHRTPPDGLTLNEWWAGTTASRASQARTLPFAGTDGNPFRFTNIDRSRRWSTSIDQQASGRIQTDEIVATVGSSGPLCVVSSLVEEAITSSLLGGSGDHSSRRQGTPEDGSRAARLRVSAWFSTTTSRLQRAEELAGLVSRLTPDHVLELHRMVTDGTLDDRVRGGSAAAAR